MRTVHTLLVRAEIDDTDLKSLDLGRMMQALLSREFDGVRVEPIAERRVGRFDYDGEERRCGGV